GGFDFGAGNNSPTRIFHCAFDVLSRLCYDRQTEKDKTKSKANYDSRDPHPSHLHRLDFYRHLCGVSLPQVLQNVISATDAAILLATRSLICYLARPCKFTLKMQAGRAS